jgi:hypothetical protein
MPNQFNRRATIELGKLGETGLKVQNLRVSFNVKKTSTDTFNTAKVSIFNMAADSRRFVDSFDLEKRENILTVSAGYESTERVVFRGNVSLVSIDIQKPLVITNIEANDGEKAINQLKFFPPISYAAGTYAKKIILDIIKKTGLPVKYFDWNTVTDKQYKNGFAFQGSAKVILNNLCNYVGVTWSIQGGQLKFLKIGESDGAPILNLTPETGLLSSPIRLNDIHAATFGNLSAAQKTEATLNQKQAKKLSGGYEIKCLLQPVAEPGGVVLITSAAMKEKKFRILEVEHSGDTHGQEWISKLTTVAI